MTQNKNISKAQAVRHQNVRRLVEAGEVIVFPPLAEPLLQSHTRPVTYPLYIASVRPEPEPPVPQTRTNAGGNRIAGGTAVSHAGGTVVSPVLYSLEYRKAWKKIADDCDNKS